jgi:hypothetical protein
VERHRRVLRLAMAAPRNGSALDRVASQRLTSRWYDRRAAAPIRLRWLVRPHRWTTRSAFVPPPKPMPRRFSISTVRSSSRAWSPSKRSRPRSEEFSERIRKTLASWQWLVAEQEGQCVGSRTGHRTASAQPTDGRSKSRRMYNGPSPKGCRPFAYCSYLAIWLTSASATLMRALRCQTKRASRSIVAGLRIRGYLSRRPQVRKVARCRMVPTATQRSAALRVALPHTIGGLNS